VIWTAWRKQSRLSNTDFLHSALNCSLWLESVDFIDFEAFIKCHKKQRLFK
jgi:hypothetical protein